MAVPLLLKERVIELLSLSPVAALDIGQVSIANERKKW
jgi:hypothetical protein